MRAALVIPFDVGDMEAGEYELFDVDFCSSLECRGEVRPIQWRADECYECMACGTVWDPNEPPC